MESPLLSEIITRIRPVGWETLRQQAEQALINQTWPDIFQKSWSRANLDSIKNMTPCHGSIETINSEQLLTPETEGSSLVFVNGCFNVKRSNTSSLPSGVQLLNLASNQNMTQDLGSLINIVDTNLLANLNSARFLDGLLLIVPEGAQIKSPLRVSFINNQPDNDQVALYLPRLFILLKKCSSATLLESYQGYGHYVTASMAEVIINNNARLNHERIQQESAESLHFSQLAVRVGHGGYYNCRTISLGGRSSLSFQHITMVEHGANVTLDGLTVLGNNQNSNTKTTIDHQSSNCTSKQTNRIVADNSSLIKFDGTICVHKNTQGTNAQQQCRGLLLDAKAQIHIKPQLKIYTDEVKCSHEAAVGQLDSEMLFYLQSRGIHPNLARNMLTCAFASYLLADITIPSLKRELYNLIMTITNYQYLEMSK